MESQRVFIGRDGKGTVQCPSCWKRKPLPPEALGVRHRFKVRCTCGFVFAVRLDSREKHRKDTDLEGFILRHPEGDRWGELLNESIPTNLQIINCKVKNLSVVGIGLLTTGRHLFTPGEGIRVRFSLDNPSATSVAKRAFVRTVQGKYLGCEFFESDKYDRTLGFYLL